MIHRSFELAAVKLLSSIILLSLILNLFPGLITVQAQTPDPNNPTVVPQPTEINPTEVVAQSTDVPATLEAPSPTDVPATQQVAQPTETSTSEPAQTETDTPQPAPTETATLAPTSTDAPVIEPTSTEKPGFSWELSLDYTESAGRVGSKASAVASHLKSLGVTSRSESLLDGDSRLILDGAGSTEIIRQVIYEILLPDFNFLKGSGIISIQTATTSGSPITVYLESQPGTGYTWGLNSQTSSAFTVKGSITTKDRYTGPGSTALQTIILQPSVTGQSTLELIYQRPFEKNEAISRHLTITLPDKVSSIDLSDPQPPVQVEPESALVTIKSQTGSTAAVIDTASLPTSFDWRTSGNVSDIRNQGNCGSCWAFGVTGIMESALRINTNTAVDLSEQFLVSCNVASKNVLGFKYSCQNGGTDDAQQYNINTLGEGQNSAGAVLESSLPYTAQDDACPATPLSHPYKASSWNYVGGVTNPTVDQIKSAIYSYGPVTSDVCAGVDSFYNYSSTTGVYTDSHNCYDHLIDLVGWDNSTQSWILRNSWGPYWGQSGYMRIGWGVSNVGTYATYVTMTSTNLPTLISPSGNITDQQPTYEWNSVTGAGGYQLKVTDIASNTVVLDQAVPTSACSAGVCSTTPDLPLSGNYKFEVAAAGQTTFSSPMTFSNSTPLAVPTLVAPSGPVYQLNPVYQWDPVSGATGYLLTVTNLDTNVMVISNSNVASSACTSTLCSTTPTVALNDGSYQFTVAAKNIFGPGDASTPMTFSEAYHTPPAAPALLSPSGTAYFLKPVYQWSPSIGSAPTGYLLTVTNKDTSVVVINNLSVPTSACKGTLCSYTPSVGLPDGNYTFSMAAKNSFGTGSFSTPMSFSEAYHTSPAAPSSLLAPSGNIYLLKPTYQWSLAGGSAATSYLLTVTNTATNAVIINKLSVSASACKGTLCSYTPSVSLADGNYEFVVAAKNAFGTSAFSDPLVFNDAYHTQPAVPTLVAPNTTVFLLKPAYQWNPAGGSAATSYLLIVTKTDTNTVVINKLSVSASACKGSLCSFTPSVGLLDGPYQFAVAAKNSFGTSDFSSSLQFTEAYHTPPAPPTLLSPGATTNLAEPTYQWNPAGGSAATGYTITVTNTDTSTVPVSTTLTTSVCKGTVCSYTPPVSLINGHYQFVVTAKNSFGTGSLSIPMTFSVYGFDSEFNGSAANWLPQGSTSWKFSSTYYYTLGPANGGSTTSLYNAAFSDFDFSAKMKRVGGSYFDGQYWNAPDNTLLMRSNGSKTAGYAFSYYQFGPISSMYAIWKIGSDGKWTMVIDASTAALVINNWNVLRVTANGSTLNFYINDQLMYTFTDSTYTNGSAGFGMSKITTAATTFEADYATLGTYISGSSLPTAISPEQQALNEAGKTIPANQINMNNMKYLPPQN